jgi:hypothetical protein
MKYLKMLGLAAVAVMALMAIGAGSASATTLELEGNVVQSGAVTIEASATAGLVWTKTDGSEANTCSVSSVKWTTSSSSGPKVTGSLSVLSFETCKREKVTVDAKGGLYVEHEPSTTSGEVYSEGTEVTLPTPFGFSATCSTGSATRIATLDAASSASSHATMTVSAILNCGVFLPSVNLKGTYKVSSSTGLGVVA